MTLILHSNHPLKSLHIHDLTSPYQQARNLKRYINQLTYAKAQCERRITVLKSGKGGEAAGSGTEKSDTSYNTLQNLPGRKVRHGTEIFMTLKCSHLTA